MQPHTLQSDWSLVTFRDFTRGYLQDKQPNLNLKDINYAHAYLGCNGKGIPYTISSDSTIVFSTDITTTYRHCDDMRLEREFVAVITTITSYKIVGNFLILSNAEGERMVFEAAN
jgi:heat shock protein HslJ